LSSPLSGGLSLARSFKAGIKRHLIHRSRVSDGWKWDSTVAKATRARIVLSAPALKDRAKLIRRSATKMYELNKSNRLFVQTDMTKL